jgi:hypothetical protein
MTVFGSAVGAGYQAISQGHGVNYHSPRQWMDFEGEIEVLREGVLHFDHTFS